MVGLRERRHQQTKAQIVDVGFALFLERGFENVTMEEVAAAAGVSRSTAYRRFPTKEHVVLEAPRQWLAEFDRALDGLAEDASLADAVEVTARAVARYIDDNRDLAYTAYTILQQSPLLQPTGIATSAWLERYVAVIQQRADFGTTDTLTIAGAYLGAIDAVMQNWASTGGASSVADGIEVMLNRLAPIITRSS